MWDIHTLAELMAGLLARREAELALEQAVYGLDYLDEIALQTVLADGLVGHFSVAREVLYPTNAAKKNKASRQRCDLVLTPKGKPLHVPSDEPPGLFSPAVSGTSDDETPADKALWLEVKIARQFRSLEVVHGGYGSQWRQALVADLQKMESETGICHAALAMVVFNQSREVLDRDLQAMEDVLVLKGVLAGFRQVGTVPISDRMGHRLASVAIWPKIQRGLEPF